MADWVHCNLCFKQPGGERKFSLTNCGHIYCEECLPSESQSRCKMCGKEPVTTILLTAKMKYDVEIFFLDPAEIVKKQQKQLLQVMDFQKNHRLRLTAHNRDRLARQESMMHKAQKAMEQCRDLEKEKMVLREENSYLKKFINSTGASGHPSRLVAGQGIYVGPSPGRQGMVHSGHTGPSPGKQGMVHSGYIGPSQGRQLMGHGACGGPSPGSRPKVMTPSPSGSFMCSGQKHKLASVEHSHMAAMQNRSGGFIGASRLCVRTPPSNGRMGGIPHTPSPNSLSLTGDAMQAMTPSMQAMTPCRSATVQGYSPMSCSPAFGRRSNVLSAPVSQAGKIGLSFCHSSTKTPPTSHR